MNSKCRYWCIPIALVLILNWVSAATAFAGDSPGESGGAAYGATPSEDPQQDSRSEESYQRGTKALDTRQWEKALAAFDETIKMNGNRVDGALYWKAYAENKLGQRDAALGTLGKLTAGYPKSRWAGDAKALELEIRQSMGQAAAPEAQADDDLKLMAINSLINTDPERAIPLLEKIINGNQPQRFKRQALMVLAQSGSTKARELLIQIARGNSNSDLQLEALRNLGLFGGKESRQTLAEIYTSVAKTEVKREILHAYMVAGDREKLLAAAKEEKDPGLRRDAIHQLGVLGAKEELWAMYQASSDHDTRAGVLQALFVGGATDRLSQVALNEKDVKLRTEAIRLLGVSGSHKTAGVLLSLYEGQTDPSVRKAVLEGLFVQGNATAMIQLARKEKDPTMKKEIVSKLSVMGGKEATDYMMEILNGK